MRTNRQGLTLIETTVAMIVLAAAVIAVAQLIATVAVQRHAAFAETLARREAANQMERVFAMPWGELRDEKVAVLQMSPTCRQRLPDPKLTVVLGPVEGTPPQRHVRVEVTWPDTRGQQRRSARLTAWRYDIGEAGE